MDEIWLRTPAGRPARLVIVTGDVEMTWLECEGIRRPVSALSMSLGKIDVLEEELGILDEMIDRSRPA